MKKKGQIAIEYMLIVGIATVVAISLLGISSYYSGQVEDIIDTSQLDGIVKEIVDAAESMYYFGQPSKTTVKVYMPKGIKNLNLNDSQINYDLSFSIYTRSGLSDVFYKSSVPLNGTLQISEGFHFITIESRKGYVWINST